MTATTSSTLGQGSYSTLPDSPGRRLGRWLYWPAVAALIGGALYLVFLIYAAGQAAWASGALVLLTAGFYVYLSRSGFAWRYLFPGVAGMLVFIAFPLVYTAQIGFTNYSSTHLLNEGRVRDYLLEQHDAVEDQVLAYSLHADGAEFRLVLQPELA
ncbi:MAG: hypothetical protein IIA03_07105 [Proteobacteria bacterium]|nr:hypothetical protein [Pseudomonadota bacterium]